MTPRAWAAFAAVSLLWGIPYMLIKVVVQDGVSPGFLAWGRVVLGALALLALAPRAGALRALRTRWRWIAVFALAEIVVPFLLLGAGEQRVSSSLAGILIAAAPLFVALLALRFDASERVGGLRLAGLLVGLAGVIALMGVDVAGRPSELVGAVAVLGTALCYAIGPMVLNRHLADLDPRASMGAALILAAALLTPAAIIAPPHHVLSASALAALVGLGLLCTAAALVLYGTLVAAVGPGRALVITYINPVVAVALGTAILGERPGLGTFVGLPLILAGSYVSTGGRLPAWIARRKPLVLSEEEAESVP